MGGSTRVSVRAAFPRFERQQFVFDGQARYAILDGLNNLSYVPFDRRQIASGSGHLRDVLPPLEGYLGSELLAERSEHPRIKQPLAHRPQGTGFNFLPFDAPVILAGPSGSCIEARQPIVGRQGKAAAAQSAVRQS